MGLSPEEWELIRLRRNCTVKAQRSPTHPACVEYFTCEHVVDGVEVVYVLAVMLVQAADEVVPVLVCSCDKDTKRGALFCRMRPADRRTSMTKAEFAARYPTCVHAKVVALNESNTHGWSRDVGAQGFLSHRSLTRSFSEEYVNHDNTIDYAVSLHDQKIVVVSLAWSPPAVVRREPARTTAQERWVCKTCSSPACPHTAVCNSLENLVCPLSGRVTGAARGRHEASPLAVCKSRTQVSLPLSPDVACVIHGRLVVFSCLHFHAAPAEVECDVCHTQLTEKCQDATLYSLHSSRTVSCTVRECRACKKEWNYDGCADGVLNLDNRSVGR